MRTLPCNLTTKEVFMESKKSAGPVIIHFANPQEAIDLAIRIELKYFLAKLLYSHYNRGV